MLTEVIAAIDRYDPERGTKLSTFVYGRMTGATVDAIRRRVGRGEVAFPEIPTEHADHFEDESMDPLRRLLIREEIQDREGRLRLRPRRVAIKGAIEECPSCGSWMNPRTLCLRCGRRMGEV